MSSEELLNLLTNFEKRLATIADQAAETREQAQHTLERIDRLRHDLAQVRQHILSTVETQTHQALRLPRTD
jgi:hypothetical protein